MSLPRASKLASLEGMAPAIAKWAVSAISAYFLVLYASVAIVRLRYPFELEWIEGGMVDQVRWILAGHKLYVRPSIEFVPFLYNPLYFWICAVVSKIVGVGFFALRLVSFLSSVGTMALLFALAVHETKDRVAGVVAAGAYAATFMRTAQFMDVARIDSLVVLFLVAGLYVLRTRTTLSGRAVAGTLFVLAFLTKQSSLLAVAPVVLFLAYRERLRAWPFVVAVTVGIGGSVSILEAIHDGWYWYYAFDLAQRHEIVRTLYADFWIQDLLGALPVACLGALFVLVAPRKVDWDARGVYASVLAGVLAMAWTSRLHSGGWVNVLMPAYAVLAVLLSIAIQSGAAASEESGADTGRRTATFLWLAALAQLTALLYDPRHALPKARDRAAGERLIATIRSVPGEVFMPTHSYLPVLAGKKSYLHQMAVDDLVRAGGIVPATLSDEIRAALRSRRFSLVITDNDFFDADVLRNYRKASDAFTEPDVFFPVTGVHYRPGGLFVPR